MYLEAFLANGYDDFKQLTEMSDEEQQDVVADVNMTMKGCVCRFISDVAVTKSAMKNPPALTVKDSNRAVIQDKQSSNSTAPDYYFSGQWIHRWRQVSKRKEHENSFNDLNSTDSQNGNSMNVNKAQLLDANSILKKVWKANESKFYDSEISVYANMFKVVSEKYGRVEATAILLRRRFLLKDMDEAE
ncbi:Hypothetical predicted protein [Paramuricea clavata]|uniref:Uncharacterized protein n=1 Tax=Paramuricea clavata TaxID=317549 RepID=A0A7D9ITY3_PARCT|nr:Hypothetical predicted protein [Paramuricea clavata]